jgi:hypothetical protein
MNRLLVVTILEHYRVGVAIHPELDALCTTLNRVIRDGEVCGGRREGAMAAAADFDLE